MPLRSQRYCKLVFHVSPVLDAPDECIADIATDLQLGVGDAAIRVLSTLCAWMQRCTALATKCAVWITDDAVHGVSEAATEAALPQPEGLVDVSARTNEPCASHAFANPAAVELLTTSMMSLTEFVTAHMPSLLTLPLSLSGPFRSRDAAGIAVGVIVDASVPSSRSDAATVARLLSQALVCSSVHVATYFPADNVRPVLLCTFPWCCRAVTLFRHPADLGHCR